MCNLHGDLVPHFIPDDNEAHAEAYLEMHKETINYVIRPSRTYDSAFTRVIPGHKTQFFKTCQGL